MAINTNTGKQSFTATADQTDFDFNFKIFDEEDIKVYQTPTGQDPDDTTDLLTYASDYTVTIDGDDGGTVTLLTGATLNDTIVILRDLPKTRTVSFVTGGDLIAETLNDDQEYQTYMIIDGYNELREGTVTIQDTDVSFSPQLPATEAGKAVFVNDGGTAFEFRAVLDDNVDLATWLTDAEQAAVDAEQSATDAETAQAAAEAAAGSINLPALTSGDVGKLLFVNATYDGYDLTDPTGEFVELTGAQTVAGVKTFSSFPVTPSSAPTTDYQAANKKYVDDSISVAYGTDQVIILRDTKSDGANSVFSSIVLFTRFNICSSVKLSIFMIRSLKHY
jgi:hypothetical protein